MRMNSSGLCAMPPTGPTEQMVGVRPPGEAGIGAAAGEPALGREPGLGGRVEIYFIQPLGGRVCASGTNSPRTVELGLRAGHALRSTMARILAIVSSRSGGST